MAADTISKGSGSSPLWRWRRAVMNSDLGSQSKHILHVLSCHMDNEDLDCFPGLETIIKATSLSKSTILKHLKLAQDEGWIKIQKKKAKSSRGWPVNHYQALWPNGVNRDEFFGYAKAICKKNSPRNGQNRPRSKPQRVRSLNTNSTENSTTNSSSKKKSKSSFENETEALFERLMDQHPGGREFYSEAAKIAFWKLTAEEQQQAIVVHNDWLEQQTKAGRKIPLGLREYLEGKHFKRPARQERRSTVVHLKPFSREMYAHRIYLLLQGETGEFKPNKFQVRLLASKNSHLVRKDELSAKYPEVFALDSSAWDHSGTRITGKTDKLVLGNAQTIEKESPEWKAWQDLHDEMNWPWLQVPKSLRSITMPISIDEIKEVLKRQQTED